MQHGLFKKRGGGVLLYSGWQFLRHAFGLASSKVIVQEHFQTFDARNIFLARTDGIQWANGFSDQSE